MRGRLQFSNEMYQSERGILRNSEDASSTQISIQRLEQGQKHEQKDYRRRCSHALEISAVLKTSSLRWQQSHVKYPVTFKVAKWRSKRLRYMLRKVRRTKTNLKEITTGSCIRNQTPTEVVKNPVNFWFGYIENSNTDHSQKRIEALVQSFQFFQKYQGLRNKCIGGRGKRSVSRSETTFFSSCSRLEDSQSWVKIWIFPFGLRCTGAGCPIEEFPFS